LSRDVSRFFQAQSRTSDTTLAAISGFERLRADIARAGFLASPNLARDANRCPRPATGSTAAAPQQNGTDFDGFAGLQQMAMLRITDTPTAVSSLPFYATLNNGVINPDGLTLYGNYSSTEQFPVRSMDFGTNPVSIRLEQDSPALLRVGIAAATTDAAGTAILTRIFRSGSILRIVDETGREQYAIISGATFASGLGIVTISNVPSLIQKGNTTLCGIRAHAAGLAINPVNIIRYSIDDVRTTYATNYQQLSYLFTGAVPSYEGTRLELMRYEVPPTVEATSTLVGVDWPGTTTKVTSLGELVAEYAVDLAFGLTVLEDYQTGSMATLGETANLDSYAGDPTDSSEAGAQVLLNATTGPHFIRGVHARLSVRYREADREASTLANPSAATAEALLRVQVATGQFARTRSFRGHISTRNTQNLLWN